MAIKKLQIFSLFLLTLVLSLSLISAANFVISTSTPTTLSESNKQSTFTILNPSSSNKTLDIDVTLPANITDSKGHTITPTSSTLNFNNVAPGNQVTVNVTYLGDTTNFITGTFAANMNVYAEESGNSTNNLTQSVPLNFVKSFCKSGENGTDLEITKVKIDNTNGDNADWKPLDPIKVDVKVSNNGASSVKSVIVKIGLLDPNGKNVINNMDNLKDDQIKVGSIKSDGDHTASFTFTVPVDFNADNYKFVAKAYSDDVGEAKLCVAHSSDLADSFFESITGSRVSDSQKQVIVNKLTLSPDTAQCAEIVQLSGEVFNVGDTDYSDQVKVTLVNSELGINLVKEIRGDLNQGDSSSFNFEFKVPANASEKDYQLGLKTYYDYNTNDATYNTESADQFVKTLTVKGGCTNSPSTTESQQYNAQITAELDSSTPEATAGKPVVVKATLKNTGKSSATYVISVVGNSVWSNLVSVDPQTATLQPGESKDVLITLDVNSGVTGDQEFTIRSVYNTGKTTEQKVVLPVKSTGYSSSALTDNLKQNWFIYVIVLVNVILIVAIILVIRRIVSPREL